MASCTEAVPGSVTVSWATGEKFLDPLSSLSPKSQNSLVPRSDSCDFGFVSLRGYYEICSIRPINSHTPLNIGDKIVQSSGKSKFTLFAQHLKKEGSQQVTNCHQLKMIATDGKQRMTGQETRNKLTDYWKNNAIKKGQEFAILTSQNLRDHMSESELIFTALVELSTRKINIPVQAEPVCGLSPVYRVFFVSGGG